MHRKSIIILLIFLFFLSGCAPRINVEKATSGTAVQLLGEDVLIFGRIRWIQNGEENRIFSRMGAFTTGLRVALQVLRLEDNETGTIEVEKDGRFFLLLPSGSYIIHRVDWGDFWGSNYMVPRVAFRIAEGEHSYYLGTLGINIKIKRNTFGTPILKGLEIRIEDEEGYAMEAFREKFPNHELKTVKALMIHDPMIPNILELENQKKSLDSLRSLWMEMLPILITQ